jgi:hypothetical protein
MSLGEIHSYVFNKKYVKDAAKEKHELAIKNYAKVLNEKTNNRRTRFTTYGISSDGSGSDANWGKEDYARWWVEIMVKHQEKLGLVNWAHTRKMRLKLKKKESQKLRTLNKKTTIRTSEASELGEIPDFQKQTSP